MPEFPGIHHVAVTVSDIDRSRAWYEKLFGAPPVMDEDAGEFHHAVWIVGGNIFGIHGFAKLNRSDPFDERSPGLDHVGFACADRAELEAWQKKLDALGVKHGGIVDAPYGSGLSFRDPDNIALEFFAMAGAG